VAAVPTIARNNSHIVNLVASHIARIASAHVIAASERIGPCGLHHLASGPGSAHTENCACEDAKGHDGNADTEVNASEDDQDVNSVCHDFYLMKLLMAIPIATAMMNMNAAMARRELTRNFANP